MTQTIDPRMRAILLVMLNLCMYLGEANDVDRGDIDLKAGTVVTRRPRTGIIRAGVLWT